MISWSKGAELKGDGDAGSNSAAITRRSQFTDLSAEIVTEVRLLLEGHEPART